MIYIQQWERLLKAGEEYKKEQLVIMPIISSTRCSP